MEQETLKASTGISIGLVIAIITVAIALLGGIVGFIFLKCKEAWQVADGKVEERTDTKVKVVDDKVGSRVREIYIRMEKEKDLTDEKINDEVKDLQTQNIHITENVTKAISEGFDKVHEKMDSMTTQIHKIDKKVAVIEGNSNKRRQIDGNGD